jgi:uncharacterized protein YdhG (YjbR/CyaY superfamily)
VLPPDPAVDAYVENVPEAQRPAVTLLRDLSRRYLTGFTEQIRYGMPGYVRTGGTGESSEVEIGYAAQKRYVSFYVTRTDVLEAHRDRLATLSVGKGCVRYRRPEQVDADVVRSILEMTAATRGPVC